MAGQRLISSTWYSEIGLPSPNEDPACGFSTRNLRRKASYSWHRLIEFGDQLIQMGKLDPRKIAFAAKFAIALMIVAVLVITKLPFEQIGLYSVWPLLTVVVVFEFSVGIVNFRVSLVLV